MRTMLVVILVTILLVGTAQAQTVVVKGVTPCSLWASTRAGGSAAGLEAYQQGLINGIALGRRKDFWTFPYPIEPEQAFYWMDQYCAKNPLRSIIDGTYALFEERFGKGWNLP